MTEVYNKRKKALEMKNYKPKELQEQLTTKNRIQANKKEIKQLKRQSLSLPSYIPESLDQRIVYVRYADDWIILMNKKLKNGKEMKREISTFLSKELKMELRSDKTHISKTSEGFSFLCFNYNMPENINIAKAKIPINGRITKVLRRTTSRESRLSPDIHRILKNLPNKNTALLKAFPWEMVP
jgi:hypothetical protein